MSANVNRLAARKLVQSAFLALVLALLSSQGRDRGLEDLQFGEVSIEAPSGWEITYRQVDEKSISQARTVSIPCWPSGGFLTNRSSATPTSWPTKSSRLPVGGRC